MNSDMDETRKKLLDQITFFHTYYAKTQRPEAKEILENLAKAFKNWKQPPTDLKESLERLSTSSPTNQPNTR